MQIDVNGVKITLTKDQLKEIVRQTQKSTIESIDSYEKACEVLGWAPNKAASDYDQLLTIIKAANFIDNGNKEWNADFADDRYYKYLPHIAKTRSGGWSLNDIYFYYSNSYCPVGFYYKSRTTAEYITKKFIKLYSKVWG